MIKLIAAVLLVAPATIVESFDDRVAVAKAAETDAAYTSYQDSMFEPVGSDLATAMRDCFDSTKNPSADDFTLVAELDADGTPTDIALRPETNVATCVSRRFATFRFPPPPKYPGRRGFPIVLDLHLHMGEPPRAI